MHKKGREEDRVDLVPWFYLGPSSSLPSLFTDEAPVAKRLSVFRVFSFLDLKI